MNEYLIVEVITNNIVRVENIKKQELILIGKGIGFKKHANDFVTADQATNIYEIKSQNSMAQYRQVLKTTSPKLVELANEAIDYIQNHIQQPINEHIHIALTDHIAFMVKRCKMGIPIQNPFDVETKNLYPKEYKIATEVVEFLSEQLGIFIPKSEVTFITLHIVSAISNDSFMNVQKYSRLVAKLVSVVEHSLMSPLNKDSLNYSRFVTHLRFTMERIERNEKLEVPKEFAIIMQEKYPACYSLAYRLVAILQNEFEKDIDPSEITYLTIHLYRFGEKS